MKHLTTLLAAILLTGAALAAPIATIPADTNVGAAAIYSQAVTGGTLYVTRVTDITGQKPDVSTNFVSTAQLLPNAQVGTLNATTGSLAAGKITGALNVTLISSNATPGAQLVRTAAQMLADFGVASGFTWNFAICNSGAGTLTLTADSGATVTLSGTMTVAQNVCRRFIGNFTGAATATITSLGSSTYD
jgi:hypothetical protein